MISARNNPDARITASKIFGPGGPTNCRRARALLVAVPFWRPRQVLGDHEPPARLSSSRLRARALLVAVPFWRPRQVLGDHEPPARLSSSRLRRPGLSSCTGGGSLQSPEGIKSIDAIRTDGRGIAARFIILHRGGIPAITRGHQKYRRDSYRRPRNRGLGAAGGVSAENDGGAGTGVSGPPLTRSGGHCWPWRCGRSIGRKRRWGRNWCFWATIDSQRRALLGPGPRPGQHRRQGEPGGASARGRPWRTRRSW